MKVRVEFFSHLRDAAGTSELELDLPNTATVTDLLEQLYLQKPALRARDKSILIGAGVEFVERDYILRPSDQISLMPPFQGG